MNAIYHPDAVRLLLDTAQKHNVSLLFVTNNVCNQILKFEDSTEVISAMGLEGLMKDLAVAWYGPHLKGKFGMCHCIAGFLGMENRGQCI